MASGAKCRPKEGEGKMQPPPNSTGPDCLCWQKPPLHLVRGPSHRVEKPLIHTGCTLVHHPLWHRQQKLSDVVAYVIQDQNPRADYLLQLHAQLHCSRLPSREQSSAEHQIFISMVH